VATRFRPAKAGCGFYFCIVPGAYAQAFASARFAGLWPMTGSELEIVFACDEGMRVQISVVSLE